MYNSYGLDNLTFTIKLALHKDTLLIFNNKIASRFIENILDIDSDLFEINSKSLKITNVPGLRNNYKSNYRVDVMNTWYDFIYNKSVKNVVLLYRDPFKRLITSIVQDATSPYLLRDMPEFSEYIDTNGHIIEDLINNSKLIELLKINYKNQLNILFNGGIENSHYNSHNLPLAMVLSNIDINVHNIKLFDIDLNSNEFNDYIKKLEMVPIIPRSKYNYSNKNKGNVDVHDIISISNTHMVYSILQSELYGYGMLNKIKDSINRKQNYLI